MIYTRFGSEVELLAADLETGMVDIKRKSDGEVMYTWLPELRADDGFKEIEEAAKNVPKPTKHTKKYAEYRK